MVSLAAIIAALIVPLGLTWSRSAVSNLPELDDSEQTVRLAVQAPAASSQAVTPVFVTADGSPRDSTREDIPEAVKLFCVGTLLVGLSAAARKAV